MLISRRRLTVLLLGAAAVAAPLAPGRAQQGNTVLGPPQLRDFQLPGERRTPPAPPQPVAPAPAANSTQSAPAQPAPGSARTPAPQPRAAETPRRTEQAAAAPRPQAPPPQAEVAPLPAAPSQPQPLPVPEAAPAPAPQPAGGPAFWIYLIPAALAALGVLLLLRRRRRTQPAAPAQPAVGHSPPAAVPPRPRPDPVPRPWLELELKVERAAATPEEARVDFEMVIHNSGKSPARNIRVNARMFNAGRTQDEEIGAFFKTRGEGRRTHTIPELPAGERGLIQGSVTMPREEMRALRVNDQALFIPVVGVNLVYDWGNARTGQTSKSYVIGRELGTPSEKMGAFRLDAGPRVYRTVGQRPHSLARRT